VWGGVLPSNEIFFYIYQVGGFWLILGEKYDLFFANNSVLLMQVEQKKLRFKRVPYIDQAAIKNMHGSPGVPKAFYSVVMTALLL
jgi:hypothetical protein